MIKISKLTRNAISLALLISIVLSGCNSSSQNYIGSSIDEEFPIPINATMTDDKSNSPNIIYVKYNIDRSELPADYFSTISKWGWYSDEGYGAYRIYKKDDKTIGMTIHNDFITLSKEKDKILTISPFDNIKVTDVEWITKRGGLPSDKSWATLTLEEDSDKITKILNFVNSSNVIRKSTEDDLNFLNKKHGYPVDIIIKFYDDSEFLLKSAMELTTEHSTNGTVTTQSIYKDRFILVHNKEGTVDYYTVFSNDVAEYIIDTSNIDFQKLD